MNNCTLIGRLGKDAESKQHGERYRITFSIATSEKRKDGERTDWHNVTYWSKSNAVTQYLAKGAQVAVSGAYRNDKGNDGKYWYYLDAVKVELLGGKQSDNEEEPF